jgi:hypothetical protein
LSYFEHNILREGRGEWSRPDTMKRSRALFTLDKFGAVGAILAAAAAPCCFPLLAAIGAALGLGALQAWRGYMDYAIQAFAVISALGGAFAFRRRRRTWPLGVGLASAAVIFFAFYASYQVALVYLGLAGLAVAAIGNVLAARQDGSFERRVELMSTITCPHCGHQQAQAMPTNACVYFFECPKCHATLRPKPGDCCVFCSYGSVKCPPIQSAGGCCAR